MKRLIIFGFAMLATALLCGCASKPHALDYFLRGLGNEMEGNYEQAIADYTKSIRLDPQLYPSYWGRADAYSKMGEYDKAIADYTQAIAMNNDSKYHFGRGKAYYLRGDREMAIADFDVAIRGDENSARSIRHFLEEVQSDLISRYPVFD